MPDVRSGLRIATLIGVALACNAIAPAEAACPSGSQFFGYSGDYGCIIPGPNTVVAKCWKGFPKGCHGAHFEGGVIEGETYCCLGVKQQPKPDPHSPKVTGEQCRWEGTAPKCEGSCQPGEVQRDISKKGKNVKYPGVSEFGEPCWWGYKVLCCRPAF